MTQHQLVLALVVFGAGLALGAAGAVLALGAWWSRRPVATTGGSGGPVPHFVVVEPDPNPDVHFRRQQAYERTLHVLTARGETLSQRAHAAIRERVRREVT